MSIQNLIKKLTYLQDSDGNYSKYNILYLEMLIWNYALFCLTQTWFW